MRKFIGTLVILALLVAVVGFFRGWISFTTDSAEEKAKIEVTIDKERLKSDTDRIKEKVRDFSAQLGDDESGDAEPEGSSESGGNHFDSETPR